MSIRKLHPKVFYNRSGFTACLLNILAVADIKTNPNNQPGKLLRILTEIQPGETNCSTNYTKALFLVTRTELSSEQKDFKQAVLFVKNCIKTGEKSNMTLSQIMLYHLLIKTYNKMGEHEKSNKSSYKLQRLLEEKDVSFGQLFLWDN